MPLATCRFLFIMHACLYNSSSWSNWSYSFTIGVTVKMAIEEMERLVMETFFR